MGHKTDHPEEQNASLSFRIHVKAVQARVLPDADDAFATEASEFDTLVELEADLRELCAVHALFLRRQLHRPVVMTS